MTNIDRQKLTMRSLIGLLGLIIITSSSMYVALRMESSSLPSFCYSCQHGFTAPF